MLKIIYVSIPLEQGNVFRQKCGKNRTETPRSQSLWNRAMSFDSTITQSGLCDIVSIPLEQGNVFRHHSHIDSTPQSVSIPLEQGNVFRLNQDFTENCGEASQSLWNRAMSFDVIIYSNNEGIGPSQSLWNRAMSFDVELGQWEKYSTCLNPFGTGQCLSTLYFTKSNQIRSSQSLWNRAMSFDKNKA